MLQDEDRHLGDRARRQEFLGRHVDAKGLGELRHDPESDQGIAAEIEELVVDAHVLELERFGPEPAQAGLDGRARSGVRGGQLGAASRRRRQGAPVHLADAHQRQRVEQDEGRRDHVLR